MSNTARHIIGTIVGVVVIPLVLFSASPLSMWAMEANRMFRFTPQTAAGVVLLLALGLFLGALAGSRMSPLAALVPGVVLTLYGVLTSVPATYQLLGPLADLRFQMMGPVPYLIIGGVLIGSALWPSRWRATPPAGTAPWQGQPGAPQQQWYPSGPPGGYQQPWHSQAAPGGEPQEAGSGPQQPYAPPGPGEQGHMSWQPSGGTPASAPSGPYPASQQPHPGTGPQPPAGAPSWQPNAPGAGYGQPWQQPSGEQPAMPGGGAEAAPPVPETPSGGHPAGPPLRSPYPDPTRYGQQRPASPPPGADEPHLYGTGPIPTVDGDSEDSSR